MFVLVTGAKGFIGRHLTSVLSRAADVELLCVARRSMEEHRVIQVDMSRRGWTDLLPAKADVVFHLAQSSHYRNFPQAAVDISAVNVDATVELAAWAHGAGVRRFVFASSGNVYGHTTLPVDETAATDPRTMYAASKLSAELLLRPFAGFFDVVVARLFGVYGAGQAGTLFPSIIDCVENGKEIVLAGGVGVRLNPIYVDDCVDSLIRLSKAQLGTSYEVFNVGGTQVVDLAQVVKIIESLTSRSARVRATEDQPTSLIGDVGKLLRCAGCFPMMPLSEGLSRTIAATN